VNVNKSPVADAHNDSNEGQLEIKQRPQGQQQQQQQQQQGQLWSPIETSTAADVDAFVQQSQQQPS